MFKNTNIFYQSLLNLNSFAAEAAEIVLEYFFCLHVCICPQLITTFWVLHILQEGVLKASSSQKYLTFEF